MQFAFASLDLSCNYILHMYEDSVADAVTCYLMFYENVNFYVDLGCGADGINYHQVINPRTDTLSFRLTAGNLFQRRTASVSLEKIENREGSARVARYILKPDAKITTWASSRND